MSDLRELLELCMGRGGNRPTNEEIARAALLAEQRIAELENALTETLNAFAHERQFGDSPFIQKQRTKFNIDEYRAIAKGEK